MNAPLADDAKALLLIQLDEGYDAGAWHGPNLRGSLKKLTVEEASWKPSADSASVWELIVHCAYWKYVVWRRLAGVRRGAFPRKGSDWFARPPDENPQRFADDLALLDDMHAKLRAAVEAVDVPLDASTHAMLRTIGYHDVYHAGQVQTLRRLWRARERQTPPAG